MSNRDTRDQRDAEERGRALAKSSRVVFCGIVRDCRRNLARNLDRVESLRDSFASLRIVLVENDSKDGTKSVLRQLLQRDPSAIVEMDDHGIVTLPKKMKSGVLPSYSEYRISKMAAYRNRYLEIIEEQIGHDQLDWIVMLDWDIESFSSEGLFDTLGRTEAWQVATANGRKKTGWAGSAYYDSYAVRLEGATGACSMRGMADQRRKLSQLGPADPLLVVESAFNGMGIYPAAPLAGLRYRVVPNQDPEVEVWCEHVTFHRDLAERGCRPVVINPRLKIDYNTRFAALWTSLRGLIRPLIRPFRRLPET